MCFTNTTERFGIITKFFHWVVALAFIAQFYLVYRREYFPKGADERLQYILLHKSIGFTVFALGILFIIWHAKQIHPKYPTYMPKWEFILAKSVQGLFFLTIIAMPITGILMSQFADKAVHVFGLFTVPAIVTPNKKIAHLFHDIHAYISYLVIALFTLHVLGALKHHFIDKNNLLKRMLPFGK